MKLHTYLNYGGNCEQAFRFYEEHLGGKVTSMMPHGAQPPPPDAPPSWEKAILHARMTIGGTELMASDVPPQRFEPMRSVYLSLAVNTSEEADRIYTLLQEGGEVFMPMRRPSPAFFGLRCSGTSSAILDAYPRTANAVEFVASKIGEPDSFNRAYASDAAGVRQKR